MKYSVELRLIVEAEGQPDEIKDRLAAGLPRSLLAAVCDVTIEEVKGINVERVNPKLIPGIDF